MMMFILALTVISCGTSKVAVDDRTVQEKMNSKRYTFLADHVYPTGGFRSRYLSPGYDLKITPDTISAYLPYFGRAYQADYGSTDGGIKFTSTDFEYKIEQGKKPGNWIVNIRTKDQRKEVTLTLNVWNNGKASLDVHDQTKQPILFQGELE